MKTEPRRQPLHLPISTLLPVSAREALIQAATNPFLTEKERTIAIARATQQARTKNPKLFKEIES